MFQQIISWRMIKSLIDWQEQYGLAIKYNSLKKVQFTAGEGRTLWNTELVEVMPSLILESTNVKKKTKKDRIK